MSSGVPLHRLSATRSARLIAAGQLSSEELVQACLDRISEREPQVNAWTLVGSQEALRQARACDAAEPSGPLHGVPVGVKDLIDTVELPTEYGSPIYAGHHPAQDAVCVDRLRAAGAVVLGKTVTTEFALFHPGPTANPHDLSRTPGGSSSGSAAAVADHMVPLTLGTQTAGSIVRPASFCGIYGVKPTYGGVPTEGTRPASPSLDTLGVFARTVDDLVLAMAVVGDGEYGGVRSASAGAPPRVAFVRTSEWDRAEDSTQTAVAELAAELGCDEITLPDCFADLVDAQVTVMEAEVAAALASEYRDHADQLSDGLRESLERGRASSDEERQAALATAAECRARLDEVFADHDAVLAPSVLGEAPEGLDATGDPLFCRAWTLLGTPCVAVPGLTGPAGVPLGVQVVGPLGADAATLAAAAWVGSQLDGLPQPPEERA